MPSYNSDILIHKNIISIPSLQNLVGLVSVEATLADKVLFRY